MKNNEKDIAIIVHPGLTEEEVKSLVAQEIHYWDEDNKQLARLELSVDPVTNDILVKATEKSPIRRVRRITGYLSNFDNFNEAKRDETEKRYKHDTSD